MLIQPITEIHLNSFKFKHKIDEIQGLEVTLKPSGNRLGFGHQNGFGFGSSKEPVMGWLVAVFGSKNSPSSPLQ